MTPEPHDGPPFGVEQTFEKGVHGLAVTGEIDVATSPELRHALHTLVEAGRTPIEVDLSAVTFIDSSGLGALVSARNELRERGIERGIVLRGLHEPIRKVFEITGLTDLFASDAR